MKSQSNSNWNTTMVYSIQLSLWDFANTLTAFKSDNSEEAFRAISDSLHGPPQDESLY